MRSMVFRSSKQYGILRLARNLTRIPFGYNHKIRHNGEPSLLFSHGFECILGATNQAANTITFFLRPKNFTIRNKIICFIVIRRLGEFSWFVIRFDWGWEFNLRWLALLLNIDYFREWQLHWPSATKATIPICQPNDKYLNPNIVSNVNPPDPTHDAHSALSVFDVFSTSITFTHAARSQNGSFVWWK